jgi:hypothetical protein
MEHAQSDQDNILTNESGNSRWWRKALSRFIFVFTEILGFIGFYLVVVSVPVFNGVVIPAGLFIGVTLYLLTAILRKKKY